MDKNKKAKKTNKSIKTLSQKPFNSVYWNIALQHYTWIAVTIIIAIIIFCLVFAVSVVVVAVLVILEILEIFFVGVVVVLAKKLC